QYYVDDEKKKRKSPWRSLLAIPIMLLVDVLALIAALAADAAAYPAGSGEGHPFPAITFVAFILLFVITVIVVLVAVIKAIVGAAKRSEEDRP
ncbi:MAG: hypothetical protein IIZ05_01705, partial [Firmicutes bacterium]|nr:hypothetical protein [Bacillota bacterium]